MYGVLALSVQGPYTLFQLASVGFVWATMFWIVLYVAVPQELSKIVRFLVPGMMSFATK